MFDKNYEVNNSRLEHVRNMKPKELKKYVKEATNFEGEVERDYFWITVMKKNFKNKWR